MIWLETLFTPLCVAGLLFWPVYQVITRRWSNRSRRLLMVFLGTAVVLSTYASLLWGPWRVREWSGFVFLMPLTSLVSIAVSISMCFAESNRLPARILRSMAVLVFVLLFAEASHVRFILDWRGQPVCHKVLMTSFDNWTEDNGTNAFPNIGGNSRDSLAELRDSYPGAQLEERYTYVAGLHKDDPGDLVLMYVNEPSRWTWHGGPKTIFSQQRWITVPVDFTLGQYNNRETKITGGGECSEALSPEQFGIRLQRTLDFVRTNNRPNWQTVVAEHSKLLESLKKPR